MDFDLEAIASLAKRRGFIYQGSEIYGGLAGTWDYGPLGVALKRNLTNMWWKFFVEDRQDMLGIDSATLMNSKVWQASGHVATFSDPLVEDTTTKKRCLLYTSRTARFNKQAGLAVTLQPSNQMHLV